MTRRHGTLITRLIRGTSWSWRADPHVSVLPADLDSTVMTLETSDRHHAKQGRSTARVRFDSGVDSITVYLKRHYRLPWITRVAALIQPGGRHSPASAEWEHLERARALGIAVPEVVAVGEWVGPWGALQSYLMVAELTGHAPLHEALPELARSMAPGEFAAFKRILVVEVAEIAAKLHAAHAFHKDLYLCHFFLDQGATVASPRRLCLIDLHRLAVHRWSAPRWRWKDLGQLLFSTLGVEGINDRDRLRFWVHYQRRSRMVLSRLQLRLIRGKSALYLAHNNR